LATISDMSSSALLDAAARAPAWRERERIGKVFGETIAAIE
jgi:hypothetical protein